MKIEIPENRRVFFRTILERQRALIERPENHELSPGAKETLIEFIDELLVQVPERPISSGWKPIETAPKDGRIVKLLIPYSPLLFTEEECTDKGYWEPLNLEEHDPRTHWFIPEWGKQAGGCWRFDGDDGSFDIQPTHWDEL